MKSEQLSPDLRAGHQPIPSASAVLLARGSGARPCHSLWGICQCGDRIFIRSTDAWVEAATASGNRADRVPGSVDSDHASAVASQPALPAGDTVGSIHSIFANPGSRDGCTSNTLPVDRGHDFAWRNIDHALAALAAQHRVEQLVPCGNALYALAQSGHTGSPGELRIFSTSLTAHQEWEEIATPDQSATAARRMSHLVSFDESLFCTVDDEISGFQLWRLATPPAVAPSWTMIIDRGGQDHSSNARVTAVYADREQLLLACAPGAELAALEQHPVGPELILVRGDNSWDLIVGTTRLTPGGLVVPRSLLGRGFDNPAARQIASITRCENFFYVCIVAPAIEGEQLRGQIWSSEDLCSWSRISLPHDIRAQDVTLVSALRTASTTLLVMKRQPTVDSVKRGVTLVTQEVPGLLRDIEFWLLPGED